MPRRTPESPKEDDVLRRMLETPPKPHPAPKKPSTKRRAKKKPAK